MVEYIKLSKWAKLNNLTYRGAYNHWVDGRLKGKKLSTGTILIEIKNENKIELNVVTYARVSSSENKSNLKTQSKRLQDYCSTKGYIISQVIEEVGSGLNDTRKKLLKILGDKSIDIIVVEHKDRLTRFGFNHITELLKTNDRKIEVINKTEDETDNLMEDFVSVITSFCARLYGKRRSKRKTEKIISELKND